MKSRVRIPKKSWDNFDPEAITKKKPLRGIGRKFLGRLAVRVDPEKYSDYPQTMYLATRFCRRLWPFEKPMRRLLWWLCDLLIGHEVSETDWGYGGGWCDHWCRWCDKMFQLPPRENPSPIFKELRPLVDKNIEGGKE